MVHKHGHFPVERLWGDIMNQIKNLDGQRFGSLTVIKHHPRKMAGANAHWLCQCDCGNLLIVRGDNFTSGHSKKCSHCTGGRGHSSIFVKEGDLNGVV